MRMQSIQILCLTWLNFYTALGIAASPQKPLVKQERALVFAPAPLQKKLDVTRLGLILKRPSHVVMEEGSSDTLEKFLIAKQEKASQAALERLTALATELLRDKKTEPHKTKIAEEMEDIVQTALKRGWFGPFVAIRNFTVGMVHQDAEAMRLLFANSEDLPPTLPTALRNTVDLHKAEWLAENLKANRGAQRTKIFIGNGTDWPRAKFCLYTLNGQPFTSSTNLVIAGMPHQLIETCANGKQRSANFELKPFQRDQVVLFSNNETSPSLQKISESAWTREFGTQNIDSFVVVDEVSTTRWHVNLETKNQFNHSNIAAEHMRTFEHQVQDVPLAADAVAVEVYPSLWWGAGSHADIFVESLPKGEFLGLGAAVRYSDFMLSLDGGFFGLADADTALWLLARAHWTNAFSLDVFRGLQLRPLLGAGVLLVPESQLDEQKPLAQKIYGSAGVIFNYKFSEKLFVALGTELNLSLANSTDRLVGLSMRIGREF